MTRVASDQLIVDTRWAVFGEACEIHATIVRTDGNRVNIELLRPQSWVREEAIEVGQTLRLEPQIILAPIYPKLARLFCVTSWRRAGDEGA